MFTLKIPRPEAMPTYSHVDHFFGPFALDGKDLFYDTKHRHSSDFLVEQKGIFGENHCQQRQLSGSLALEIFREPADKGGIRLDAVNSFGNDIGPKTYYHYDLLSSAFSWKLSPSYVPGTERLTFIRKLSPVHTEVLSVTWHYVSYPTLMTPEYVDYSIRTIESPSSGAYASHPMKLSSFGTSRYPDRSFTRPASADGVEWSLSNIDLLVAFAMKYPTTSGQGVTTLGYTPRSLTKNSEFSFSRLTTALGKVLDFPVPPVDVKSHGELAIEAVDTLDSHSVNIFEFVSGLRKPWELLPKLRNLGTLKNASENYLTLNYGILPTVDDLTLLKDAILNVKAPYFDSNDYQVLTAGHRGTVSDSAFSSETVKRVKIAVDIVDYDLIRLQEQLRKYGVFPSIDNLWELIPFSFVIDWFISIGDILESLDNRMRMAQLPIVYSTISTKTVTRLDAAKIIPYSGVRGTIVLTNYSRSVSHEPPEPPLSFEVSNGLPSRWLEAGALIIANQKN